MPATRATDRHVMPLVILTTALCLAYFYLVDRAIVSTAGFAPIFKFLLIRFDSQTAWVALAVSILAVFWRKPGPILALVDGPGRHPRVAALAGAIAFSLGSRMVYHNYSFSMDEYAATFQSKIFASGRLWAQLPPNAVDWLVVRGFNGEFLCASRETGRAIGAYWPGFSLLLAPFQFLGVAWACNAILSACALCLIHQITLELTGNRRAAGWALLFTLSSSAFWAYAISYYSMQAHLTINLLFAWLLLRSTKAGALAAGLLGSLALNLHNPFPHVLFAAPWLAAMAFDQRRRPLLMPLIVGYLPGLCLGIGWLLLRLDIAPTPAGAGAVAQGAFTWPDIVLANVRVASLVKLFLWSSPCLLFLAALGVRRDQEDCEVRLLACSMCLTFLGYCFVRFDQGHGWGYRYFHSTWGVVPILAGVAMARETAATSSRLIAFAGASAVLSFAVTVPFQMWQIERIIAEHLAQLPPPRRPGGNVFFIKPGAGFYLADMIQIDPLLRGPDLLLATRGEALDAELIRKIRPTAREIDGGAWGRQWIDPLPFTDFSTAWREAAATPAP